MFKQLACGLVLAASIVCHSSANASVSALPLAQFPAGPVITFTGLADNTEVNGLSINGVQFSYSLGNGQVIIDGGPGATNNISPPNVVSTGNNTGTLTLTLTQPVTAIGYGFAILGSGTIANATTITLFSGANNVGSLSYAGTPDPNFPGGFAGIQSTIAFDRVQLVFNSTDASSFALDNIRLALAPVMPVPALTGLGLLILVFLLAGAAIFASRRLNLGKPGRLS